VLLENNRGRIEDFQMGMSLSEKRVLIAVIMSRNNVNASNIAGKMSQYQSTYTLGVRMMFPP